MKAKHLLTMLCACICSATAQHYMLVTEIAGAEETVSLADITSLTFTATEMTIHGPPFAPFPLAEIRKLTFTDATRALSDAPFGCVSQPITALRMATDGRVHFRLSRSSRATLLVHDALGRQVKRAPLGTVDPGQHTVALLTRGDGRTELGAGTYVITLLTPTRHETTVVAIP